MAPLVLAMSCQSAELGPAIEPELAPPAARSAPAPAPADRAAPEPVEPAEESPRDLGKFNITFYYVVGEEEIVARPSRKKPPSNDNLPVAQDQTDAAGDKDLVAAAPPEPAPEPPEKVTLYGPGPACEPIAETSREFMSEAMLQGTGKLRDGRLVNMWGRCKCPNSPCFHVVEQQWGIGGAGRPLQPFRSVAVDPKLIKLGSLLYVPVLEGRTMPGRPPWGGYVHDGCVIADDTGGAVKNYQLDLFVGRKAWFHGMSGSGSPGRHSWARQVPVLDGSKLCERKGRKISRKSGAI
ncbi:MAG TPA: 3D domain-containing protein [Kofleriaceae bacterium]|nr:3D domain-containing protein [Kofleriaceae bacterium]